MQHSQLRKRRETVKLFAHKDPNKVQKTLKVLEFQNGIATDITPTFEVSELNTGYYSTEIETPDKDCYLLILFCESPIVLKVGSGPINFMFYSGQNRIVPFKHYNEFGILINEDNLIELQDGFYFYGPLASELGYIEIYNRPNIINIPYCDPALGVAVAILWSKKVIVKKFGSKIIKQSFKINIKKSLFKQVFIKQSFNINTLKESFGIKINKLIFKTKRC